MTEPYYQDKLTALYNKDCRNMSELEDNSIDLMVTDPPYGYSFMGKDWDKAVIPTTIWKECLRVLKAGAFTFVMCSPRQDCLGKMVCNLSDAGFETGFTSLYWAYASGFPKAQNIAKVVDRKLKQKGDLVGTKKGIGREGNVSKGYSYNREYAPGKCMGGEQVPIELEIRKPASEEAKTLDGSYGGFQPKPAVEVILVVMKPLDEKTFVDQALQNRKGISWLDDGRIPHNGEVQCQQRAHGGAPFKYVEKFTPREYTAQGRFPANLVVSDDVLNDGRKQRGGITDYQASSIFGNELNREKRVNWKEDIGSFSRYFDLDKWAQKTFPFLIVPKASKGEKNKGLYGRTEEIVSDGRQKSIDNPFQRGETPRKNIHPTCKPLKLMSYLIILGSREGDTILDPFVGSGTTCLASKLLNRKSVGYELEESYCEIAKARCRQMILEM